MEPKHPLQSRVIISVLAIAITILSGKIFGVQIPKDSASEIANAAISMGAEWQALIAACIAGLARLRIQDWDFHKFLSFRMIVALWAGVMGILQAAEIDVSALHDIQTALAALWTKLVPAFSGLLLYWGMLKAKKPLAVPSTDGV